MRRILARRVTAHLVVLLVAIFAAYAVSMELTPVLLGIPVTDFWLGGVGERQRGRLDQQTGSLVTGLLAGAITACAAGAIAAYRFVVPLRRLRAATRAMTDGSYETEIPELEQRELGPLAADLNQLGRTLAEIERRRRRLLGEVAHEMRTPLTVIDGYVEGMIDGILPATPTELAHVSEEVRRLRRLADDLSTLSKAEEGRLDLRPLVLDLRGVTVSAIERLRPQIDDAGLRLSVRPGDELLPVRVDADRFSQVVRNLVGNAVRATAPGGSIDVSVGRSARWAWLVVADTGEGIDAADLERIFERFYRVPTRRAAGSEGGSGIGLTISRGIVRAHGGDLVARSAGRDRGAQLVAWVPAVQ